IGKPVAFFSHIPANSGLHLLPIPFSSTFADYYTLGEFTHKDYPTLIGEVSAVSHHAASPELPAVIDHRSADRVPRHRPRAVHPRLTRWATRRARRRHPRRRDINLAASVPGCPSGAPADDMLKRIRPVEAADAQGLHGEFASFLKARGPGLPDEQREALFRE